MNENKKAAKQKVENASAEGKTGEMKENIDRESEFADEGSCLTADGTGGMNGKDYLRSQQLETLGILVGGIAHDFNNILNVITGHVSLMERWRTDPERFKRSLDAVKKATERGANTARQLLTFTRDVGAASVRVNLGDAVREIIDLIRETFPDNITYDVRIDEDIPWIPIDSNQIHQALLNLCLNARDALPAGGTIRFEVKTDAPVNLSGRALVPRNERFVCLTVADDGAGMEKDIQARVFEPFFTTKGGFGTGLGLAVVDGIVKGHGGFIDVKSTPGKGSSFSLYFPIPADAPGENLPPASSTGKVESILVIEDEEPLRDFLRTMLAERGYRVLTASGGMDGLQTYKKHLNEIGVVLLDMGLPEMTGTEVLSGLLVLNPNAKVISASGYLEPELKEEAMEIGAVDFLTKPYKIEELTERINIALRT